MSPLPTTKHAASLHSSARGSPSTFGVQPDGTSPANAAPRHAPGASLAPVAVHAAGTAGSRAASIAASPASPAGGMPASVPDADASGSVDGAVPGGVVELLQAAAAARMPTETKERANVERFIEGDLEEG